MTSSLAAPAEGVGGRESAGAPPLPGADSCRGGSYRTKMELYVWLGSFCTVHWTTCPGPIVTGEER